MKSIFISLAIGVVAGLIDIAPMIAKKLETRATVSAFVHYVVVSFVVAHIALPIIPWWAKGSVVSLLMAVPVAIIVSKADPKSVGIILVMSIVLGALIGIANQYLNR